MRQQEEKIEMSSQAEEKEEEERERERERERESGRPMRAGVCVTCAVVFQEKKTWKCQCDTSGSILDDNDDVRGEKCCE